VQLAGRSDAELVTLAQRGWAPAFAVLLRRHGGAVRAVADASDDVDEVVVATFTTAMRRLPRAPTATSVRTWLVRLAGRKASSPQPVADDVPGLDESETDELWARLAPLWPNGRHTRRVPSWLRLAGLTIVLVSLGVIIPYVTITFGQPLADARAPHRDPLRAVPVADLPDEAELEEVAREEPEEPPELFADIEPELRTTPELLEPNGPDEPITGDDTSGEGTGAANSMLEQPGAGTTQPTQPTPGTDTTQPTPNTSATEPSPAAGADQPLSNVDDTETQP
jgi:hypothetical protein